MEENIKKPKSKKKLIIISTIGIVIVLVGIIYFVLGANYESTDNAQLDADIIPIKSSVPGYIKSIHFEDNQHVEKGDLLFTLDDTELKTKVAQAEAALENAKANLIAVQNSSNASNQNSTAAFLNSSSTEFSAEAASARLKKAKTDYSRIQNMFEAKAATQAELDGIKAELDVAKAQYEASMSLSGASQAQSKGFKSQALSQQAMISLAEAMVRQREAELVLAKTYLDYATIEAPAAGIVTRRSVETGQFITIGQPLCSTIDIANLWITANFKETQVGKIHPGQEVEVKIDAYPSLKISGKVDSYIGATGAKFALLPPDNSTGNFVKIVQRVPVKISLKNLKAEEITMLFPGLSAYVSVKVK